MALYTAWYDLWYDDISSDASLLHSAVDHGFRRLGYERIKTEQLDAVESLLSGKDVFLSIPIGFGKSLVYRRSRRISVQFKKDLLPRLLEAFLLS